MTVKELTDTGLFTVLCAEGDENAEITKPFCCDLLSIAMSKAPAGSAWVTVMGNINTLAVAVLCDVACIILAEGTVLDTAAVAKAEQQGVTILKTDAPVFETALKIHEMLSDKSDSFTE